MMRAKECGESECCTVIEQIGIEQLATSSHAKAGRLPHGLSLRDNLSNFLKGGDCR
ncbi:hypothetical protein AVE81_004992 [Salmonella enterica subsp. diarizonae]|nr:hypothetical protein [Salmonella enterica subsp. diarizonae]EDW9104012.1 hypothetical protein [Salmonella enterica subsp. diarizonae]